ncbi:hypothetical protein ABPG72_008756 [Tetrahymena utriculariae]
MNKYVKGKQILLYIIIQNICIYCQSFSFSSNTLTQTGLDSTPIISATYQSTQAVAVCQQSRALVQAIQFSNTYVSSNLQSFSSSQNCISVQFYPSTTDQNILSIYAQSGIILKYEKNDITQYNSVFSISTKTYTQTVSVQSQGGILVGFSTGDIFNIFQNTNYQTFNNCTSQVIGLWYSQITSVNLVFAACGATQIFIYDKSMSSLGYSQDSTIYYAINSFSYAGNEINLIKFIKMGVDTNYTCGAVSNQGGGYKMYVQYYLNNTFNYYSFFALDANFVDIYGFTSYFIVLYQNYIKMYDFDGKLLGQSTTISNQFTIFSFLNETNFMTVDNQNTIQIWSSKSCPYYCICSSGSFLCTSCPPNSNRSQSLDSNSKCPCNPGFYDDGKFCQTCSNSLGPRTINVSNGSCLCTQGYTENQNKICTCNNNLCLACNPQDGSQCSSCKNNTSWKLTQDNNCVCQDGFYYDSNSNDCIACTFPCSTCVTSSTNCISCINTTTWQLTNNQCSCQVGYYLDSNAKDCLVCPLLCSACNNSTECTSCKDSTSMQLNTSQMCECQNGYYLTSDNSNCLACTFPCSTCVTSSTNCISCVNTTTWQLTNNQCSCQVGYYLDSNANDCLVCPLLCSACNNSTGCTSCKDSTSMQLNTSQMCECQNRYYLTSDNSNCLECSFPCSSCQNSSINCTACKNTTAWQLVNSSCSCQTGYYFDSNSNDCLACSSLCSACNTSTQCTSCKNSQSMQLNTNNDCECKSGFILDQNQSDCLACTSTCSTCSGSSTNCTSCKNTTTWQLNGSHQCVCQDGYYYDLNKNDCLPCSFPCKTCSNSSSQCTSCQNKTNWQLIANQCQCMTGYFLDLNSQECLPCPALCQDCSNNTQCSSCKNSSSMELTSTKKCQCLKGYFLSSDQSDCLPCASTCSTCESSSTNCTSCKNTTLILTSSKQCQCIDGYYFQISLNDCMPCPPLCSTCTSSNFCITCKNSTSMQLNSNNICECSHGYILSSDQSNCTNCSSVCLTCNNDPNYCLSCRNQSGWSLDTSKNTCYCTDGYYLDTTNQNCQQCSSNCKTCKGQSSYCLSCYSSFYLSNNQCSEESLPTNISEKTIQTLAQATQSAAYIAIGSTTASSVIFSIASPNGGAVQQFMSVQKLYFLLFIDIVYPQLIYTFFKTLSGTSPLILFKKINLFSYFIKEDKNQTLYYSNGIASFEQQYKNYRFLDFQETIPQKFRAEKVTSSAVENGGGPIVAILAIWILVLPILLINFFKKDSKYGNLLKSRKKESSLYNQNVTTKEKIYYYYKTVISILIVMLHETIIIVLSFSVVLQVISFSLYGLQTSNQIFQIIFIVIIFVYAIIASYSTYKIINSEKNRLNIEEICTKEEFQRMVHNQFLEDYIKSSYFSRNFKFTTLILSNIMIPIVIAIFYSQSYFQIGFWLFIETLIFVLRIIFRPQKDKLNNIKLIVESALWMTVLILILLLSFQINQLQQNNIRQQDIETIDKYNIAITICVFLILFLNPIILIIKLILNIPFLLRKINQYLCKKSVKIQRQDNLNSLIELDSSRVVRNLSQEDLSNFEKQETKNKNLYQKQIVKLPSNKSDKELYQKSVSQIIWGRIKSSTNNHPKIIKLPLINNQKNKNKNVNNQQIQKHDESNLNQI